MADNVFDFGKYSVKELSNEGADFQLTDPDTGEKLPVVFKVYGIDSDKVIKAREEVMAILGNDKVKAAKKALAGRKFIAACIKTWEPSFTFKGKDVEPGDEDALLEFLDECPFFKRQFDEFIGEYSNFLSS